MLSIVRNDGNDLETKNVLFGLSLCDSMLAMMFLGSIRRASELDRSECARTESNSQPLLLLKKHLSTYSVVGGLTNLLSKAKNRETHLHTILVSKRSCFRPSRTTLLYRKGLSDSFPRVLTEWVLTRTLRRGIAPRFGGLHLPFPSRRNSLIIEVNVLRSSGHSAEGARRYVRLQERSASKRE